MFMIRTLKGYSEKAWAYATTGTGKGRDSWDQQSSVFSFLERVPGEAKVVKSALVTPDQVVLEGMKEQEAGSDTVGTCTSGKETSVGLGTTECCNQCLD